MLSTVSEKATDLVEKRKPAPSKPVVTRNPSSEPTEMSDPVEGWDAVKLDGNVFKLGSNQFYRTTLVAFGTMGHADMRPADPDHSYPNCFWRLREDERVKGVYVIESITGHVLGVDTFSRIGTKYWSDKGLGDRWIGLVPGNPRFGIVSTITDEDLWRIVKSPNQGTYYITNYKYPKRCLTQFSLSDWGWTEFGDHPHEWCLTPRYVAKFNWTVVWQKDNREGSKDFSETTETTTGVTLTNSTTLTTEQNLTQSLTAAVNAGIATEGASIGASLEVQETVNDTITKMVTGTDTTTWSEKDTITYTAPAYKDYRVLAVRAMFSSDCVGDDMELNCEGKIEESWTKLPPVPSGTTAYVNPTPYVAPEDGKM